ncbi:MAG TPA: VWA domain-containing protein [Bryobacteraceae bacterium]|nr:VWA domain-containing protein [Bryobacteraceae bacterium]
MQFLNLSLGELLGLVGGISAAVVALYLLDRSKRRQIVSTLHFWAASDVRTDLRHRRKIQQPWSLILQLISLALLLTAIAGPRLGVFDGGGRNLVVILDTSAYMGASAGTGGTGGRRTTLMDEAKALARAYVRSLPSRDNVMLVRADALATPATAFESNRQVVEDAIRFSQAQASALNLGQAFEFAQRAQKQAQRSGEIVFAGAGRVGTSESGLAAPSNLRVLNVASTQDNVGLRKIGARRRPGAPDTWDILVAVRNYGTQTRAVNLELQFAKSPAGSARMTLKAGAEQEAAFAYKSKVAGYLEVRLDSRDAFPQDDRAILELPPQTALRVAVYSNEPQLLRPLFGANPAVEAVFDSPANFDPAVKADLVVLDRFAPPMAPRTNSIWIEPPASGSPVSVRETRKAVKLERWRPDSVLGEGLRTQDATLDSAESFTPAPSDQVVAEGGGGALVVARIAETNGRAIKLVAIGFHPGRAPMKYELATPLLIANILRWMTPDAFRRLELQADTVGTVTVPLEKDVQAANVRVLDEKQRPLPFTIDNGTLRFFSGAPGAVRVEMGDREMVYSLTLPDVAETVWQIPAGVRRGVPRAAPVSAAATDVWPWLAVLGGLGLLADWLLFGRSRAFRMRASRMVTPLASRMAARVSMWRKAS